MTYTLIKNSIADGRYRQGYYKLAKDTFGLSFDSWYSGGYFDGSHIPYTLFAADRAVANISVNFMDVVADGRIKKYVQLGTVMTDKEYRGKGLQKYIFGEIIKDLTGKCDAIFLFANKNVLDFYPKFGFVKETEYTFTKTVTGTGTVAVKLDMSAPDDVSLFRNFYDMGNPFSALPVINGFALEMFYLGGPYADCVYHLPQHNAVVVAEKDDNSLTVLDIFCPEEKNIDDILCSLCEGKTEIRLGFTPKEKDSWNVRQLQDEDTTLFVYKDGENIFAGRQLLFPLIAHT